jgi:hypothetical protein
MGLFVVLCASVVNCFSLDREAFSVTNYDLTVRIEPEQHRLGVRGQITLRNDSQTPQRIAVLQISSSLDWRSVRAGDKAVQFVTQPLTSDIDHTGALSEAIVTLPQPVAPQGTVDLTVGYEGVILPDATRLTRIDTPEDAAKSSDWDQIGADFTAVRGVGYVAWYPIATEVANLSEGGSLGEVLGRWKAREAEARLHVMFESTMAGAIFFSGDREGFVVQLDAGIVKVGFFNMERLGANVPTFAMGDYKSIDVKGMSSVAYLPNKEGVAQSYADMLGQLDPLPEARRKMGIQLIQLPAGDAAPFATEGMLLMPLKGTLSDQDRLTLVYALAREKARSPQSWITEGLAHLAQVLDIQHQHGRAAALAYLQAHRSVLVDLERRVDASPSGGQPIAPENSLVDARDDVYVQNKAMWVWSMLRDMVGLSLDIVLSSYNAHDDKSSSYMREVLAKHTQRDLGWFLDDWVYHDRGLPNFKVELPFARKALGNAYIVTVTVDDLGSAGAEVPITVKFTGGEITKRLEVHAKSKAVIRIETPATPLEVVVNDGSVPEVDMSNNVYKIETAESSQTSQH